MKYLHDAFVNSLVELIYKYTTKEQRIEIACEFTGTQLEVDDVEIMIKDRLKNYSIERSKHAKICRELLKDLLGQIKEHHLYREN